jgi:hypothetical protein
MEVESLTYLFEKYTKHLLVIVFLDENTRIQPLIKISNIMQKKFEEFGLKSGEGCCFKDNQFRFLFDKSTENEINKFKEQLNKGQVVFPELKIKKIEIYNE